MTFSWAWCAEGRQLINDILMGVVCRGGKICLLMSVVWRRETVCRGQRSGTEEFGGRKLDRQSTQSKVHVLISMVWGGAKFMGL